MSDALIQVLKEIRGLKSSVDARLDASERIESVLSEIERLRDQIRARDASWQKRADAMLERILKLEKKVGV